MKRRSNRKKSRRRINRKHILLVIPIIAVFALFLSNPAMFDTSVTPTGAATVRYYSISGYPLQEYEGKIQTLVTIYEPELKDMMYQETRDNVALRIAQSADFEEGVISMYRAEDFVLNRDIQPLDISAVQVGARNVNDYFISDTKCLERIDERFGHWNKIIFVIVSDIQYELCSTTEWKVAELRHNFYRTDGSFICSQDGGQLFLVNQKTKETALVKLGC